MAKPRYTARLTSSGNTLNMPIELLSCLVELRVLFRWGVYPHGTCHGDAGATSWALACLRVRDLRILWGLVASSSIARLLCVSFPALRLRYRDTVLFGSEVPVAMVLRVQKEGH